jgi:hypothetical protein
MSLREAYGLDPITLLEKQFSARSRERRAGIFRNLFSLDQDTKILDLGSETGANIKAVLEGMPVRPRNVYIADLGQGLQPGLPSAGQERINPTI